MLLLDGVALTGSGRPVLAPEELELKILEKVDLEFGPPTRGGGGLEGRVADKYTAGVVCLTSHRLIWLDQGSRGDHLGLSCSVHLSRVTETTNVKNTMFGSRTRRLRIACQPGGTAGASDEGGILTLAFRGPSPDALLKCMGEALQRRAWMVDEPPPSSLVSAMSLGLSGGGGGGGPVRPSATSTAARGSTAGVSGVLTRQREEAAAREKTLGEAFTDMTMLMAKAKDMVQLAEQLARGLQKQGSGSAEGEDGSGAGGRGREGTEATELEMMMLSMGIASPVTRDSAGALYHQELARQLADWLPPVLRSGGGMLPLQDVFCLFNRARGSELISPDDLLKACQLWEKLRVPLQFRVFDSGVTVVQSLDRSDDEVCAALLRAVGPGPSGNEGGEGEDDDDSADDGPGQGGAGGACSKRLRRIDAYGASVALGIPPAIAGEYLLMAERHGILCRDEAPEATYYYPNFFQECTY